MKRLVSCLLLPLALAACNATDGRGPATGSGPGTAADVVGFTVLGPDGAVNAIWSNAGGTTWTAVSPLQEQITTRETGRTACCISFATLNSAIADFQAMEFRLTSGVAVPIVDVVRR
jgi:hypothetical protein